MVAAQSPRYNVMSTPFSLRFYAEPRRLSLSLFFSFSVSLSLSLSLSRTQAKYPALES